MSLLSLETLEFRGQGYTLDGKPAHIMEFLHLQTPVQRRIRNETVYAPILGASLRELAQISECLCGFEV